MTSRAEAEQLLSSLGDNDLVEVGEDGNIYAAGRSPAGFINKPIVGIADQKGEYSRTGRS
ncbi:hypothetical protein ACWD3J_28260 [Streptomyces sp. NPDC002755]|uniref:hypothetical protein n=1 Tax=Streptomyces sp. NPDC002884 TaxID=3154544 RepID=UPI00331BC27D